MSAEQQAGYVPATATCTWMWILPAAYIPRSLPVPHCRFWVSRNVYMDVEPAYFYLMSAGRIKPGGSSTPGDPHFYLMLPGGIVPGGGGDLMRRTPYQAAGRPYELLQECTAVMYCRLFRIVCISSNCSRYAISPVFARTLCFNNPIPYFPSPINLPSHSPSILAGTLVPTVEHLYLRMSPGFCSALYGSVEDIDWRDYGLVRPYDDTLPAFLPVRLSRGWM